MVIFDGILLILLQKVVTTEIYNFVVIPSFPLALSVPATDKTQCFVHLSFSSTLQLINSNLGDLQKLLKDFYGIAIVAFLKIPLAAFGAGCGTVS